MTISAQNARGILISHDGAQETYTFDFSVTNAAEVVVYARPTGGAEAPMTQGPGGDFMVLLSSSAEGGSITLLDPDNFPDGTSIRIVRQSQFIQDLRIANTSGWFPESLEAALDDIVRLAQELNAGVADALRRKLTDPDFYDALGARIAGVADPTDGADAATMQWVQQQLAQVTANPNDIAGLTAFSANLMTQANSSEWLTALALSAIGQAIVTAGTQAEALQAAGVSVFMTDAVQSADVTDFFDDIGATNPALWASLIGAVDADTMLGLLNGVVRSELDYDNLYPNGDFQVAQEGLFRVGMNDGEYAFDSVIGLSEGATLSAFVQNVGGPGSKNRLILQGINADERFGALFPVEGLDTVPYNGLPISASFYVRAAGDLTDFRAYLIRWTGGMDTITRDPISDWQTATDDVLFAPSWLELDQISFTADGTWQRFTMENVTLDSIATNMALLIVTNDASFPAASGFDVSGVKIEQGAVATRFQSEPPTTALARCQRQFYSTFEGNTAPAEGLSIAGSIKGGRNTDAVGFLSVWEYVRWPSRMLKVPTITTYRPEAAGDGWRVLATPGLGPAGDPVADVEVHAPDRTGVALFGEYTAANRTLYCIHLTADARL